MKRILEWLGGNPTEVKIELHVSQTLWVPLRGVIAFGIGLIMLGAAVCSYSAVALERPPTDLDPGPYRMGPVSRGGPFVTGLGSLDLGRP